MGMKRNGAVVSSKDIGDDKKERDNDDSSQEHKSETSEELYDPLADSDASSASSDSPPRISDAVIQQTIRCKLFKTMTYLTVFTN